MADISRRLSAVSSLPPECRDSLAERAGTDDIASVDKYMRRKFGGHILTIACDTVYVYENAWPGHHVNPIDHRQDGVAGLYMGIQQVVVRRIGVTHDPTVKMDIIDPNPLPVAVFSTSIGPLGDQLTQHQFEMAMRYERGSLASHFGKVGLALDHAVTLGLLGEYVPEQEEHSQITLHVIQ